MPLRVPDRARFLLVRLILRKQDKIHRLSKLKFQSELGPHIPDAIRELCRGQKVRAKVKEREIIDLTGEEDDSPQEILVPLEPDLSYFAEDESSMSLDELFQCLSLDEINSVARDLRLNVHKSVSSHALSACNTQSTAFIVTDSVPYLLQISYATLRPKELCVFKPRQPLRKANYHKATNHCDKACFPSVQDSLNLPSVLSGRLSCKF
jgi:hypothetical protein